MDKLKYFNDLTLKLDNEDVKSLRFYQVFSTVTRFGDHPSVLRVTRYGRVSAPDKMTKLFDLLINP